MQTLMEVAAKTRSTRKETPRRDQKALADEALAKAVSGQSVANYATIFEGFGAKGIPSCDIRPRENVFTFNAWKALGRKVKKGEHGVKVFTFAPCDKTVKDAATGEEIKVAGGKRPWSTTVFHVSQTEPIAPFFGEDSKPKSFAEACVLGVALD